MQEVDPATGEVILEDAVDCIHTAVCTLSPEEFDELATSEEFANHVLAIRSSEKIKQITLPIEEQFLAFRSWVAGIAEAGMAGFDIQGEIETTSQLQYTITGRILRFLTRVDPAFLLEYLDYVDRTSMHEGVRHRAYLIASLLPVLETLANDTKIPDRDQILEALFDLSPPLEMFSTNWNVFRKLIRENPTFLPRYLARVRITMGEMRQDPPLAVDEWFSVVLCPVLDFFVWAEDSEKKLREDIWHQILALFNKKTLFNKNIAEVESSIDKTLIETLQTIDPVQRVKYLMEFFAKNDIPTKLSGMNPLRG